MKCLNQDLEQQYRHEEKCLLNHVVGVNSELDVMVPVALQGQTSSQRISAICRFDKLISTMPSSMEKLQKLFIFPNQLDLLAHLIPNMFTFLDLKLFAQQLVFILHSQNTRLISSLGPICIQLKPIPTPMSVALKLHVASGPTFYDPTLYRSTIGALQYLTYTRLDIAFAVKKLSQYLQQPTELHWTTCKRVLRYLKGTIHRGLHFTPASSLHLQSVVARSSTEVAWLCSIFSELGISLVNTPVIWCDNQGHIEVDVHYVREQVLDKKLVVSYVPSVEQVANLFTKPLSIPRTHFSVPEFLILYFSLLYTLFSATVMFSLFFFNKTQYWYAPEKPLRRWLCSYAGVGRMVVDGWNWLRGRKVGQS
ncbi:hypothetical protein AAG906_017330 [Vitis piasezkii]